MKILLDAMMPEEIGDLLVGHEVCHVADLGWRHLDNGRLLGASEAGGFDVLITKDSNMPYQQNMRGRKVALMVLRPRSQSIDDLLAVAPDILSAVTSVRPGSVVRVAPS